MRATLKPLKKTRRDSDDMETQQRIKLLTDENCRSRQRLKERTYELEAMLFRLRGLTATTAGASPESLSVIGLSLAEAGGPTEAEGVEATASVRQAARQPANAPLKQVYVIVADKETVSG